MCQQMVSGMSFDTGNFIVASKTATPCIKSLFYGLLETYFAVYDSVVLTGPSRRSSVASGNKRVRTVVAGVETKAVSFFH
jgi:hypothetical protein